MCCTERYCTYWDKGVKYASISTKRVSRYLRWIPQHQKGYIVYVTNTRKIKSSYDVVFDESFSSVLAYKSQLYPEATAMCLAVTYTPCATSSREQTHNIIMFTQFEEGNILTKTFNDVESNDDD